MEVHVHVVRQAAERPARGHAERVRGRELEQGCLAEAKSSRLDQREPRRLRRQVRRAGRRWPCSRRSRARRARPPHPRPCTSRRRRRAAARGRARGARRPAPARAPPGRRRSGAPARGRPSACGGRTARRGRDARAGEPERLALARVGSGGRISAAISKPAGPRAWSAEKRRQAASSSGRSTWQETTAQTIGTTAYSPRLTRHVRDLRTARPVGRRPTRRSSSG